MRRALCGVLAVLALVLTGIARADEADECEVPQELRQDDAALPHEHAMTETRLARWSRRHALPGANP